MEPIMKLRMCIDEDPRKRESPISKWGDLSKVFDSLERAIKEIALKRLGASESVVQFMAEIDDENKVHIITSHGTTYDTPWLEKCFEAQCGVK